MQFVYTQMSAGFYGALPTQAHHLLWDRRWAWIAGEQARSPRPRALMTAAASMSLLVAVQRVARSNGTNHTIAVELPCSW